MALVPVPLQMRSYVSGWELFGARSSLDDIARLLRDVPRGLATGWLTSLCCLFDTGNPDSAFHVSRTAASVFLSGNLRKRIDAFGEEAEPRIAYHRPQMLLGLQLAQRLCSKKPEPRTESGRARAQELLGEALLRISDHLDPEASPVTDWREGAAIILPYYAEWNPPGLLLSMRRTFSMLSDPLWTSDPRLTAAASRLVAAKGFSPREYMLVVLGLVTKAYGRRDRLGTDTALHLDKVFSDARDRESLRRVVEGLSIPYVELPSHVAEPTRALQERPAEPFRSRPLIAMGEDRFWVVDLTLLNERMLAGLFWVLRDVSNESQRKDLSDAWGLLFERYMTRRFAPILGARYTAGPKDRDEQEITDAVVVERPAIILVEYKAGLMTDRVKSGRSFRPLIEELQEKFLRKGQLARAAVRLMRDGRDLIGSGVPRIYPVLVSLDHSLGSPMLTHAMNEVLSAATWPSRRDATVARLSVLTADDAELLGQFLEEGKQLRNALRENHEMDPEGDSTFHNFLVSLATDKNVTLPGKSSSDFREPFDAAKEFWIEQGGDELFASI